MSEEQKVEVIDEVQAEQKAQEPAQTAGGKQSGDVAKVQQPQHSKPQQPVVHQKQATPAPQQAPQPLSGIPQSALNSIAAYVEAMDPSKMQVAATGANHQVRLYRACQMLIEKTPEGEFNKAWARFLKIVEANINGVFKDTMIGRFAESMAITADERAAFFALMSLATRTYDSRGRQTIASQFDFHRTLRGGFSEVARGRLESFYGV